MSLADILLAPQRRQAVIADCVLLIESHVDSRGGLKGMALKTGMAMLKKARPGLLERATAVLLPEFAVALEPLHERYRDASDGDFGSYLQAHAPEAAQALLQVADTRVEESDSATVKSTYARLRGGAEAEVLAVMPGLAQLLGRHLA